MVQRYAVWIVVRKFDGSSRGFGKGSSVINTYPIISNWVFNHLTLKQEFNLSLMKLFQKKFPISHSINCHTNYMRRRRNQLQQ